MCVACASNTSWCVLRWSSGHLWTGFPRTGFPSSPSVNTSYWLTKTVPIASFEISQGKRLDQKIKSRPKPIQYDQGCPTAQHRRRKQLEDRLNIPDIPYFKAEHNPKVHLLFILASSFIDLEALLRHNIWQQAALVLKACMWACRGCRWYVD